MLDGPIEQEIEQYVRDSDRLLLTIPMGFGAIGTHLQSILRSRAKRVLYVASKELGTPIGAEHKRMCVTDFTLSIEVGLCTEASANRVLHGSNRVTVVNYEKLSKWSSVLRSIPWDMIFVNGVFKLGIRRSLHAHAIALCRKFDSAQVIMSADAVIPLGLSYAMELASTPQHTLHVMQLATPGDKVCLLHSDLK